MERKLEKYELLDMYNNLDNIKINVEIQTRTRTEYKIIISSMITNTNLPIQQISLNPSEVESFKKIAKESSNTQIENILKNLETEIQKQYVTRPFDYEKNIVNYNSKLQH